jgi:hypothetical protein
MLVGCNKIYCFLTLYLYSPSLFFYNFCLFKFFSHVLIGLFVSDACPYMLFMSKNIIDISIVKLLFKFLKTVKLAFLDQFFLDVFLIKFQTQCNGKFIIDL